MTMTADNRLRVVHLPARTPYARKLHSLDFRILNTTEIRSGLVVPAEVTSRWLLDHRPLTWLDALHLHHIEFEDVADLARLLEACAAANVHVVCTAHDVQPMFVTMEDFTARLRLLASADVHWVCLTHGSLERLTELVGVPLLAKVIPHGYVVPPDTLINHTREGGATSTRYLMFGAPRPNREVVSTIVNWSLGVTDPEARLHLLLRAFSPADFGDRSGKVPLMLAAVRADPRIHTTMRPYPTDDEVAGAGLEADALILPYLWGSHSGQLELAFDLGLLPICSRTGYLQEQYEVHQGLVGEPEWFDWDHGHPYLFGEKFLTSLNRANERLRHRGLIRDADFIDHRRDEHERVLAAYSTVYGGSQ